MRPGHRVRWLAPLVGLAVFAVGLAVVWTVDTVRTRGKVQRNVTVAGLEAGGMTEAEIQRLVADVAVRFGETPVRVTANDPADGESRQFDVTASAAGLVVDQAATVNEALAANRNEGVAFMSWLRSFGGEADVTPVVRLIEPKAEQTATGFAATTEAGMVEPTIERRDGQLVAVPGATGIELDPTTVVEALRPVAYTTAPIVVQVPLERTPPSRDINAIQGFVDQANALTASPLTVQAGSATLDIPPETLRDWVAVNPDALDLQLDATVVSTALGELLAGGNTAPVDATVSLQGDPLGPVIEGGVDGVTCCAPEAVTAVLEALKARNGGQQAAPVALPTVVQPPAVTRQAIEALGIIEPVASFTTRHACCEARVQNIHRMADIVNGYIIKPGEMLSINEFVGQRTAGKGFVAAPAIIDGSLGDTELGGGISQYMTTLFNAAWFAGLHFGEYSSHSIYISRYPYGREATVNYPHPDFQVVNKLPYGVLVQNSYSDTEITVTIWSTRMFSSVEQTGQERFPVERACTGVRTFRTKTYLDGTQEVGTTRAVYRNTEGIDCDGSPGGDE